MGEINLPMKLIIEADDLPDQYRDHPLKGNWKGCRDLHVQPGWILIYRLTENIDRFELTETHSDLF